MLKRTLKRSMALLVSLTMAASGIAIGQKPAEAAATATAYLELKNASFEEPESGGKIPGWSNAISPVSLDTDHKYEITNTRSFSGSYSLKVTDKRADKSAGVMSDLVEVTPGVAYTGRTKLFIENNGLDKNLATFVLRFYDSTGKQVGSNFEIHSEVKSGSTFPFNKWQDVQTPAGTAPATAKYARLIAFVTNLSKAVAYYDDMAITYEAASVPAVVAVSAPETAVSGEEITVSVNAEHAQNLGQAGIQLYYDAAKLQFVAAKAAGTFAGEAGTVTSSVYNSVYSNYISIQAGLSGETKVTGNSAIAEMKFKVTGDQGSAWVKLNKQVALNGTTYAANENMSSISITSSVHEPTQPPAFESVLANASFEEPVVNGKVPGWTSMFSTKAEYYYEITNARSASGKNSLKIVDTVGAAGASVALLSDPIQITPGDKYTGISQLYLEANSTATIVLRFYDANGKQVGANFEKHNETSKGFPVGQWTRAETPQGIAPKEAKTARLLLFTTAFAKAVAYYDDANIEHEAGEPEEPIGTELLNPGFEKPLKSGKIPNWTPLFATTGADYKYEQANTRSHSGSYSLRILDQVRNQTVGLISDPILVTPGDFYTGSGKLYLENGSTASIQIRFYDGNGQELKVGATEIHYETGKNFPVKQWADIYSHKATAPDNAVHAKLVIFTTSYAIADAYYDDMTILHVADLTPARLSITAPASLTFDQQFSVSLSASRVLSLHEVDASLYYDSKLLEYMGITPAGVFAKEGATVSAEHNEGKVSIKAALNPADPLKANSDIAHLQFKVKGELGQAWMVLSTETKLNQSFHLLYDQTVLLKVGDIGQGKLADMKFGAVENLGAPIDDVVGLFDGRTGVEDGRNVMYTTVKGIPPMFHVIDLDEHKLLRSIPLDGGGDVWSHTVTPNGTVYIAAGDQLWAYSPVTKKAEKVFTYAGENVFWTLDHDEHGNVYVATGPSGKILRYDPVAKASRDYGRLMGHINQEYVRSIAYSKGFVYGGTSLAEIHKINVETGEKVEIASPLNEEGYAYDLSIVDDKYLITRFDTSKTRYVYDIEAGKWLDLKIEKSSSGLHLTKTSLNGKVYMPVDGSIQAFNVNTHELEDTKVKFPTGFRGADWVQFKDPELPGKSLVTMGFNGGIHIFNPQTNVLKGKPNILPPSASITHKFEKGNNGKIYITGMQASKAAEYDVFTNQFKLFPMGQAGSITPYGDKVYFGVYPGANFEVYEPASGSSPTKLFEIGAEQDRPITSVVGDGKVFIGSIPDYRKLGGALMVYDPSVKNANEAYQVYRNIVQDQSIISLAYKDGKIYGSTNINGGLSSQTVAKEAKMFVWDVEKAEKIKEFTLDIPGLYQPASIGGLSIGPDGLLWGGVNGIVFAIDPASLAIIKHKNLFPSDGPWGQWGSFHAQWSDGLLYMHLGRRLVVIDPVTLDFKHFTDSEAFTIGEDGHLYFSPGSNRTWMQRITVRDSKHSGKLNINAPLSVTQGDEFEVGLYASQVLNLHELTAQLNYDVSTLEQISVKSAGSFLSEDAEFTVTGGRGSIEIKAALAEDEFLNQDEQVAVVRFKAKRNGTTSLTLGKDSESKSITVRVTRLAEEPESDSTPGNSGPAEPGKQVVNEESLKADSRGKISIDIAQGSKSVLLPAKAAQIVGNRSITLKNAELTADIAPEVLSQLQQLVSEEELQGAQIAFSFDKVADSAKQALIDSAGRSYSAEVKEAGELFEFGLSIMTKDGKESNLSAFKKPIKLTFKIKEQVNRDWLGIYFIADDGTITYTGGNVEETLISAEVHHFSKYGVLEVNKSFKDVPAGHWAEGVIKRMAAKQIAQGISSTEFAPDYQVTRAEFAALLVRTMGLKAQGTNYFADIHASDWYAPAITAAYEAGIVNGQSDTRFAPDQSITREEMAVMMVRAYEFQTGSPAGTANEASFADQDMIHSWAKASVDTAYQLGIVSGRGNHMFAPKEQLTRAEAIQVISNLLNK